MTSAQIRNPDTNIAAPNAERQPSFARCIAMPVRVMEINANPRIIPEATWKGNMGPIMAKHYHAEEAR